MPSNRNLPCECGSGLKFKKCHGDVIKVEQCKQVYTLMMDKLIAQEIKKKYNLAKEKTDDKKES